MDFGGQNGCGDILWYGILLWIQMHIFHSEQNFISFQNIQLFI